MTRGFSDTFGHRLPGERSEDDADKPTGDLRFLRSVADRLVVDALQYHPRLVVLVGLLYAAGITLARIGDEDPDLAEVLALTFRSETGRLLAGKRALPGVGPRWSGLAPGSSEQSEGEARFADDSERELIIARMQGLIDYFMRLDEEVWTWHDLYEVLADVCVDLCSSDITCPDLCSLVAAAREFTIEGDLKGEQEVIDPRPAN